MMTWCTAPTDAEQFLTARTFYVRVHGPKRKRPGKHFGGFHEAVQRLPLTVWWAVAAAVRRQVFRTLADRMVVDGWIKTSKRVVKDVRLVSRTTAMVVREAEGSLLACPLLLAQGASALQAGSPRAGRDAEKCSASGVLREVRRELAACAEPLPKTSFARRLRGCGRDRGARTSPKVKKDPPRRKKHQMPAPPRLKVLDDERRGRIEALYLKLIFDSSPGFLP